MMEIFVAWVLFAAVVGFIANNRGRRGVLWFFLSLLLSPLIGLVLVLSLRNPDPDIASSATGKTVCCPYCGEQILAVAVKCKHCQSAIEHAAEPVVRGDYFEKPDDMSHGEYREKILQRNGVLMVGTAYNWRGNFFSDFSELLSAIRIDSGN